ncbi:thioesterase II family protein [Streptomyces sp. NPDC087908]|uniref:thioesterase II family protein n=1 Tax=Streptomyces sp. NPDC087908 TaxID=3365820 RepID=UPI0037FD9B68
MVLPHSGAGPNALLPLLQLLPDPYELIGVTLPGRERRMADKYDDAATDPAHVIDPVLAELGSLPSLPTVLFGHSLGAALATALVCADPSVCVALVLSAHAPTGSSSQLADVWDDDALLDFLDRGAGTPAEVLADAVWRKVVLDLLRRDLMLGTRLVRQRAGNPLPVPTTVLGGVQDRLVSFTELEEWAAYTTAGIRTLSLPGGHFYLLADANRQAVADEICAAFTPEHWRDETWTTSS